MVRVTWLNVNQAMYPLTHVQPGKLNTWEEIMLQVDKFSKCQKMFFLVEITGKILVLTKST